jgi:hypothetical protein
MIAIALVSSAGCVSDESFIGGDTIVTVHASHDGEDGTLDGSLQEMMRAQSRATTGGADASGEPGLLDTGAAGQRCALDDQGHPVCCDSDSGCCVHSGPSGDIQTCL